ncbi:hypothetical protein [Fluviicola chungangensis]|uniref:Uncharacterized protein n=1 Tax=Fluviicola chungangensis TaxID=2597671 RepID=A0A556MJQ1_9FLAO|nr:hypothetical protein [Fluviicola chungangensis]TSJ40130.1 hypothetical protein FO442_16155 [Fluviicola chungangensis]
MKAIGILFLLVFSPDGFSQDALTNVLIHTWAGGVCCSSGTDVTITIPDELSRLDFDSLVYSSSLGQQVLIYSTDFHSANAPGKGFCTLVYGWSNTHYGYNELPGTSSYYGLPESRFRMTAAGTSKLLVYSGSHLIKEGKVAEQFTMTAYP